MRWIWTCRGSDAGGLAGRCDAAARALFPLAPDARKGKIRRMLAEATIADHVRKRLRRFHSDYGNGSLMAVALCRNPPPEPFLSHRDDLDCLATVIGALQARGNAGPVFSSCRSFRMKRPSYLV